MKKLLLLSIGAGLILSSCMPAFLQPATSQAPQVDLQATAVVLAEATMQAGVILPTPTTLPSETPVVASPTTTPTNTQPVGTPTETQNPVLLTLTATLLAGTPATTATGTPSTTTPGVTVVPVVSSTPTVEPRPLHYGTLPPALPGGTLKLINLSKVQAYISLRCTTREGYVTILEYPVGGKTIEVDAPAGEYVYEAWVGGSKMVGDFRLRAGRQITIRLYKGQVDISEK